ncbi:MAG: transglycosylase domain-containing protein, partial [Candidatus Saccharibacteria bacterium]
MKKRIIGLSIIILFLAGMVINHSVPVLRMPEPSILYDIHGQEIRSLYRQNGIQVGLGEIAKPVQWAFIAAEDKNFYKHHGIDVMAVLRALFINLKHGEVVAGGSTITQQTAKNLYLTQERTLLRKTKELYYTLELESRYSKDEILNMYLNSIYFGEGATGVEAASRTYFDKPANQLTIAESALIAGIPRRPSFYDPYNYPEHAKERQKVILSLMVKTGFITQAQADEAVKEKLVYKRAQNVEGDAPYYVQMVIDYLAEKYGAPMVFGGGLRVITTLDLKMQRAAEAAYFGVMDKQKPDLQAALAAIDPTNGEIRAMVGGRSFSKAPYNRAIEGRRQPGSSFKPFLYSRALDSGFTQASMLMCEPVTFYSAGSPPYTPKDYGTEPYHYRPFTLKEAIMVSDNIVSVRLNDAVGPQNTASYAKRFGFKGDIRPVVSLALGTSEATPLEMAEAYGVFASGGKLSKPISVKKVTDRSGLVLEENNPETVDLISPENAYVVTDMLKGVLMPGGTASHLASEVGRTAAGKTGTTQDYHDAWFVGFTPELSCAVWVGYDTPTRSVGIPGGRIAGPIWADFIRKALADIPDHDFPMPSTVTKIKMCMDTGQIATEYCPRPIDAAFINGTEPREICYLHQPAFNWFNTPPENGAPGPDQGNGDGA